MIELSDKINIKNKDKFEEYNYQRLLCCFRKDIYEHMLWNKEDDFFDLEIFCKEKLKGDTEMLEKMRDTMIAELNGKGWTTTLGFAKSGLFIYSSKEPPRTFW